MAAKKLRNFFRLAKCFYTIHLSSKKMIAIHWSPVKNTKNILKNGITKSKNGLYCFPVTGDKLLDKWWVKFFNQCGVRNRKQYNGFLFRISEDDMPAYFGHWIGATTNSKFEKGIRSTKQLGEKFRDTILWRLGEDIARKNQFDNDSHDWEEKEKLFIKLATEEIEKNLKSLLTDKGLLGFTLEDYQIVLSNSIPAKRIIKIIPQGNEFGKVLKNKRKYKNEK